MKRKMIGIVAAIVLASFGTLALVAYVQSAKDEAVAGEQRVEVYVLTKTVAKNTPVSEVKRSLTIEEVPAKVRVEDAVRDLEALDDNLVTAVELKTGEQLLASRLVDGTNLSRVAVPTGLQELTVALDPERAVGGELRAGDTVGVVLSFDPFDVDVVAPTPTPGPGVEPAPSADATASDSNDETDDDKQSPNMTHLTFHKVLVTAVQFDQSESTDVAGAEDSESDEDGESIERAPSSQLLVTLALDSSEVEQVVFAAEFGHIWLTAESPDADETGTRVVTLGEVYAATDVAR